MQRKMRQTFNEVVSRVQNDKITKKKKKKRLECYRIVTYPSLRYIL